MAKANVLIVEDEFVISDDLSATLKEYGYSVAGVAENVDEALSILNADEIDLVLLDINLNQPVDGVQIAHIINTKYRIPFIFVTAFTDSATIERVKHTNPHGYITKPYNDIDLMIALELVLNKVRDKKKDANPMPAKAEIDSIFVKTHKGREKINLSEIRWIEAYDYYAYIRLADEKLLATVTLKELEQKIDHKAFVKIHRKYSVNLNHIDKVVGNEVEIAGELIPVSRSHKEDLLERLNFL